MRAGPLCRIIGLENVCNSTKGCIVPPDSALHVSGLSLLDVSDDEESLLFSHADKMVFQELAKSYGITIHQNTFPLDAETLLSDWLSTPLGNIAPLVVVEEFTKALEKWASAVLGRRIKTLQIGALEPILEIPHMYDSISIEYLIRAEGDEGSPLRSLSIGAFNLRTEQCLMKIFGIGLGLQIIAALYEFRGMMNALVPTEANHEAFVLGDSLERLFINPDSTAVASASAETKRQLDANEAATEKARDVEIADDYESAMASIRNTFSEDEFFSYHDIYQDYVASRRLKEAFEDIKNASRIRDFSDPKRNRDDKSNELIDDRDQHVLSESSYPLDDNRLRDGRVFVSRYGLTKFGPKTLEQVGIEVGVTRERIRQIESKIPRKYGCELLPLKILVASLCLDQGAGFSFYELAEALNARLPFETAIDAQNAFRLFELFGFGEHWKTINTNKKRSSSIVARVSLQCATCAIPDEIAVQLFTQAGISASGFSKQLHNACKAKCNERVVSESLLPNPHFSVVTAQLEAAGDPKWVLSKDHVFSIEDATVLRRGRLAREMHRLFTSSNRPYHHSEVVSIMRKKGFKETHSAIIGQINNCRAAFLWDRGVYMPTHIVPRPKGLFEEIIETVAGELRPSNAIPYKDVNAVFEQFKSGLLREGIDNKSALYYLLRQYEAATSKRRKRLRFPKFPRIYSGLAHKKLLNAEEAMETFLAGRGGVVLKQEFEEYALCRIGMELYSLQQTVLDSDRIIAFSAEEYALARKAKYRRRHLRKIKKTLDRLIKAYDQISVESLYDECLELCALSEIRSPEFLYWICQENFSDDYRFDRYPHIIARGNSENPDELSVRVVVEGALLKAEEPVPISLFRRELVNSRGYRRHSVDMMISSLQKEGVLWRIDDERVVHRDVVGIDDTILDGFFEIVSTQLSLADYRQFPVILVEDILEATIDSDLVINADWCETLCRSIIQRSNDFSLIGYRKSYCVAAYNGEPVYSRSDFITDVVTREIERNPMVTVKEAKSLLTDMLIISAQNNSWLQEAKGIIEENGILRIDDEWRNHEQ